MKVILNVQSSSVKNAPSHLKFASDYLQKESADVKVIDCYFKPGYSKSAALKLNVQLAFKALTLRHDILYYGTDPTNLFLLTMLKQLGLYKKKMYAWKYIALYKSRNRIATWCKRKFYGAFDCIFMLTEGHVAESVSAGMITHDKCRYIKWGEDVDYVDTIKPAKEKSGGLTFLSTGKAYRDFQTLCDAFVGINGANLKIFTVKGWGGCNYSDILDKYTQEPNIEINYVNEVNLNGYKSILELLYAELKAADASLVICKKVNFGVGFTAILDAMVCHKPVIATYHKDNPIDIDKCGIGCTVRAEDSLELRKKIQYYIDNPTVLNECGEKAWSMIFEDYNIRRVARDVLNVILA